MSDDMLFEDLPVVPAPQSAAAQAYRVLARKYRPTDFSAMIGQEALVRTLSNAIAMNRIAHAFVLTGIRGVGKTTTARIIARALNCTGEDGKSGPTINPCGVCPSCKAIAEDRHMDVFEMDAASRTGVDDIREIIESVQYKPTMGRYKIYIIDEVHMLSNSAFNALLKTLEEPPEHVKFVFATTEIRKIPVTVLSRCQRFDLRRVEATELEKHLSGICDKEGIAIEPEALALIARAAEGSVRDSLSLTDQAIAHASGTVTADLVREMIGRADRTRLFRLFELLMQGQVESALELAHAIYLDGTEPSLLLQDLLEVVHFLARLKVSPKLAEDVTLPQAERELGKTLTEKLAVPVLARSWQMILKGIEEAQRAPSPLQAMEMILIRLAYSSSLPTPGEVIKDLQNGGGKTFGNVTSLSGAAAASPAPVAMGGGGASGGGSVMRPVMVAGGGATAAVLQHPAALAQAQVAAQPMPHTYAEVAHLFEQNREPLLYQWLYGQIRPVMVQAGRLELFALQELPPDFASRVSRCLEKWTAERWVVTLVQDGAKATPTLQELAEQQRQETQASLMQRYPVLKEILESFPGATMLSAEAITPEGA